jgi:hypothetical protein
MVSELFYGKPWLETFMRSQERGKLLPIGISVVIVPNRHRTLEAEVLELAGQGQSYRAIARRAPAEG